MLKRITLLFVMAIAAVSANAQFKIENDTLYAYGYAGTSSSSFVDINAETHIISLGAATELIKWTRITNQLPDPAWTSAVCDVLSCKGPETDTGSFDFNPGDTGYLSFHFYAKNVNASGKMVVRFYRAVNPLEYVDVVINATAWHPVGISKVENSITSSTPNPAQNSVRFSNNMIENGKLEVYNAMGQLVLEMNYVNHMNLDIQNLAAGIYTVKISDANHTSFSRIIKE